jgi:hypothetical protein
VQKTNIFKANNLGQKRAKFSANLSLKEENFFCLIWKFFFYDITKQTLFLNKLGLGLSFQPTKI